MNYKKISFRKMIFISLLIIVIIYTVISILINVIFYSNKLEVDIREKTTNQTKSTIEIFDAYIDTINSAYVNVIFNIYNSDEMSINEAIKREDFIFLNDLSQKTTTVINLVESISIFDEKSNTFYNSLDGIIHEYKPLFVDMIEYDNNAGLVKYIDSKGETQLSYLGKLHSSHITPIYISLEIRKELLENIVIPEPIVKGSSQFIISNNSQIILGSEMFIDYNFLGYSNGDEVLINADEYLVFRSDSLVRPFGYMEVINKQELFDPVVTNFNTTIIIFIILFIFSIILSYVVAYFLSRPTTELIQFFDTYKVNNKVVLKTNNMINLEYENLFNSINNMTNRINKQVEDIKKINSLKENEEIKNIRAAVNPHFQFNILNSIIWMLEDEKVEESIDALTALGKYYRHALNISDDFINIGDEIDMTYNYFELLNMTSEKKICWHVICDEGLKAYQMQPLMLQPIIENAILHGFKNKKRKKSIEVSVERLDENIIFVVTDNGVGIKESELDLLREKMLSNQTVQGSFGLWNINRRAELMYGTGYGIHIESEEGKYTKVSLKIPYNKEAQVCIR